MLGLRHLILLAPLLAAGWLYGCNAEDFGAEETSVSPQLGGRLEAGVPVSVRLWGERSEHLYQQGKAGELITISVTTETAGLDPNVRLFDPDGQEVAFDDDSGGKGHALIRDQPLNSEPGGTYSVWIETDEDQPGEVTVVLSRKGDVEGTMETAEPVGTDLLTTAAPSGDGSVP